MKRFVPLLFIAACGPDETISGFGNSADYQLSELNGSAVSVPITINIGEPGKISGQGPCNSYSANQTAPYPWFALGPIVSTRRACPELTLEASYFEALSAMTISEVAGDVLILSNDDKETLVFQSP